MKRKGVKRIKDLSMPEKKPNWGSHMVLNPCCSDLKSSCFRWLAQFVRILQLGVVYQSSQGSTGCRHFEASIQQLSLFKALVLGQWKGDIFWQVTNHH